jgi:predicted ATP-binding protein involved in virulence
MILKQVHLTHFRCFQDLSVALHPRLNVFVGKNGQGKTAILEGIAIGLREILTLMLNEEVEGINFRPTDLRARLNESKPYMRVTLETTTGLVWDRTEQRDHAKHTLDQIPPPKKSTQLWNELEQIITTRQDRKPIDLPVIAYYGIDRINREGVPLAQQRQFPKRFNRLKALENSLAPNLHHFEKMIDWFALQEDLERREREHQTGYLSPVLQSVRQAISQMLPYASNPHTVINPLDFSLSFLLSIEYQPGQTSVVSLTQLSDGYRTLLALIMDLARRMAEANPHLQVPLHAEAIVLIDEIELHLHPGWQQTILPDLQKTFPNTQFIVTTHSPQILTTVQKENLHLLEWHLENGVNVSQQPTNTYGAESYRLLEEVLKVNSRPQNLTEVQKLKEYLRLVDYGEYDSEPALNLRQTLEQVFHTGDSALKLADMVIRKHKALGK